MDTVTLVDEQVKDGRRLLERLAWDGIEVVASAWVKPADEDRWSLYIATPLTDEKGPIAAYREVLRVLRTLGNVCVSASVVKLVGSDSPIAKDLLDLAQHPGAVPMRLRRPLLGGLPVDDVYVYPQAARKPVEVTIYGLALRGDPLEPLGGLFLSFEPHDPGFKVTVEGKNGRNEYTVQTGIDWVVAAPEGAELVPDEIHQKVLAWNLNGKRMRSTANEVWSLAKLELHGFHFLHEPVREPGWPV